MTRPIAYRPFISAPRVLTSDRPAPVPLTSLSLGELCRIAGIAHRVTSPHAPEVVIHRGTEHFSDRRACYVGVSGRFRLDAESALRVLEVLAHGFHDYSARECICGRRLFVAPARRGRPSLSGRPMTPAERVRRARRRKSRPV